jgi:chorismate synthase
MSGNSFGTMFRVTTFGESHGPAVGVVIDGCPPRLPITVEEIQRELERRRPGQSAITTQRRESDTVEILSGVRDGVTLGTPISLLVRNSDQRSGDYDEMRTKFRPSHADFTYQAKFGVRAWEGGGRASARETIGRVAAGVLARKALAAAGAIDIVAWVQRVQDLEVDVDTTKVTREAVESNIVRCPDGATATQMIALIDGARKAGDSLGGVVEAVARGVPPGLGEPVFDKLDADLAKAMLSLPAAKGFEIGSGFAGTRLTGSQHNDPFYDASAELGSAQQSRSREGVGTLPGSPRTITTGRVRTRSNRSGGVQGGISNGEEIVIRVAFKPTATILREQETVDESGRDTTIKARGRHDPCVLPRAVPIVEAMMALVLADHFLRQRGQCG